MLYILKQIAKTGRKTEPAPAPDEDMVVVARLQEKVLRTLGRALTIRQVDAVNDHTSAALASGDPSPGIDWKREPAAAIKAAYEARIDRFVIKKLLAAPPVTPPSPKRGARKDAR